MAMLLLDTGNPGSFKARPGKLRTLDKDCRGDRDFILNPYVRISEVKGLMNLVIERQRTNEGKKIAMMALHHISAGNF